MTTKTKTDPAAAEQHAHWIYAGARFDPRSGLEAVWYTLPAGATRIPDDAKPHTFKMSKRHNRRIVGQVYRVTFKLDGDNLTFYSDGDKGPERIGELQDGEQRQRFAILARAAEASAAEARRETKLRKEGGRLDPDNRLEPWRTAWLQARTSTERVAVEMLLLQALRDLGKR